MQGGASTVASPIVYDVVCRLSSVVCDVAQALRQHQPRNTPWFMPHSSISTFFLSWLGGGL
jgi:hypothetical protein